MEKMSHEKRVAYTGLRTDIISMVHGKPKKALDVGCSNGVFLEHLKRNMNVKYTAGIEINAHLAKDATSKIDKVIRSDLDHFSSSELDEGPFDLVILADVLEHTKNPHEVLREILKLASKDAQIIISLPNIQHWTAIKNLLAGQWPQRDRGLFDKTHLRFFTLRSITKLASLCNLNIESVRRNYRLFDSGKGGHRVSRFLAFWPFRPFITYQYVVRMKRHSI